MVKALILNSGRGTRMGSLTSEHPKCMTEISADETIVSRQLAQLAEAGIQEVVMTTGAFDSVLEQYCRSLDLPLHITFVHNPLYAETNYIYSIYCAREYLMHEDILLMHGDLVFDHTVLDDVLSSQTSCMTVSSVLPLPEKDFKAVVQDGFVQRIGVEFFENAFAAQPLYLLKQRDWDLWLSRIMTFCTSGDPQQRTCYAEKALNEIPEKQIAALDVKARLCAEIDTAADLESVSGKLRELQNRTVYMCFSTDIIHSGHIALIRKAKRFGKLMIGVLTDEAVVTYKRFPLLPFSERKEMFGSISGVWKTVAQTMLSYRENLEKYRPDFVVHGDDWRTGIQKPIRDEVLSVLASYGGRLIEYPYANDDTYRELEKRARAEITMPDFRRARLKKSIAMKGLVTALEAHSGLTGLIAEHTEVCENCGIRQFDAMWVSSLCDSTAKGKPDIELVDLTSRLRTIDEIMDVTTKPVIFDGDTGGLTEHFVHTVRTLERMGVSMVMIEDKTGLKKNSLFGTEAGQVQASVQSFCDKIRAGKKAQKTDDFMICARIESLILERGMEDALYRAFAYTAAGADAIMIHSRKSDPAEILTFADKFRAQDTVTPLVVVPTSFSSVTEETLKAHGINIVIYANQLTRSAFPAMQHAAELILKHHRAAECDAVCMPFGQIIRLIPEDI